MIETERFYFLNNPHTGSRTCSHVFEELGYYKYNKWGHHLPPTMVPTDKPKVAMIRETVDWVASWYADYYLNEPDFPTWLYKFKFPFEWERKEKLCIYENVTDYYFVYENGIEDMFVKMGYEIKKPPIIGKNKYKPDLSSYTNVIKEAFPEDWDLYHRVLGGYKKWPGAGNIIVAEMTGGRLVGNPEMYEEWYKSQFCSWEGDKTSCGRNTIEDAGYLFCPYCGKEIK